MVWTEETLWELRQQITLNSLFVASYENTFGVDASVTCDFFDGYMEYLEGEAKEAGLDTNLIDNIFAQDNSENLWAWFCMLEGTPLPTK